MCGGESWGNGGGVGGGGHSQNRGSNGRSMEVIEPTVLQRRNRGAMQASKAAEDRRAAEAGREELLRHIDGERARADGMIAELGSRLGTSADAVQAQVPLEMRRTQVRLEAPELRSPGLRKPMVRFFESVQTPEEEQEEEAAEADAHHGGRTKWPDGDVNPASDIHIDEDEEGEPAPTRDHHAQRRDDKGRESERGRGKEKDPRVS